MKKTIMISGLALMLLVSASAWAQTNFTNAVGDNDFNNAANWDNGLPGADAGGHATINDDVSVDDRIAVLSANYLKPSGSYQVNIGDGTTGHLVIPFGTKLEPGNDVSVGRNEGGDGRLDLMGTLQVSGGGMDLFVGRAGAYGEMTVYDGAFLDARKRTVITNGRLLFQPDAIAHVPKDYYIVADDGILAFITEDGRIATPLGNTLICEFSAESTLELTLTGDFDIGDSWTIIAGVSTIDGEFGNVVSTQGFGFDVAYTPESAAGDGDGTIVATLVSAVALPVIPPDIHNVPVTTTLEWKPGSLDPDKVTGYDVYFSTDPNLPEASRVVTNELVNEYDPPEDLFYDTVYFWRVDAHEPNELGDQIRPGGLWSFTTEPPTPQVLGHPESLQIKAPGATARLTVDTLNGEFFEWYKQGDPAPLTNDDPDVSGADTDTLSIDNLEKADEGFYHCEVWNSLAGKEETVVSNAGRIMTERMVAHWTFEDTLVDEVDGWVGRYINPDTGEEETVPYVTLIEDVNAIDGKAIEFFDDGNNVQIHDLADPEYFNFYTLGLTVSCWIKTDVVSNNATIISKQKANKWDGWQLASPDTPSFTLQDGANPATITGPDSLTDGEWHMVTAQFDGKISKLYVDATLVNVSEEIVKTWRLPGEPLVIGADDLDGGGPFDGLVDDVRIWNYAIDPIEIARVYSTMTGEPACTEAPEFDLDDDCAVGFSDLALFAEQWAVSNWVNPD